MSKRALSQAVVLAAILPSAFAQTVLHEFIGTPESQFGCSVDAIGDVDGDGVPDILVGARANSTPGSTAGAFHVYSGASGAPLYSVQGNNPEALMGWYVSRLGDVDGDGRADFLVDYNLMPGYRGVISVRSGLDGSELHAFVDSGAEDLFLAPLEEVGDVDGDGKADYITSSFSWPNTGYLGRVWVRSGADSSALYTFTGSAGAATNLGTSVAGVGDLDSDGRPDFAFSGIDPAGYVVEVHSGRTGALLFALNAPSTQYNFGSLLAAAGDVDNDGTPDLLVGRAQQGLVSGEIQVFSGATHQALYTVQGLCKGFLSMSQGEYFPYQMAALGDLNGDGFDDFGASAITNYYVYVYSGLDGTLLSTLQQAPPGIYWNGVPALAGNADFDGDGRPDVIVGQMTYVPPPGQFPDRGRVQVYTDVTVQAVGTLAAFGDGSGTQCPCGNNGQPGAGCANSTGAGGELRAYGHDSVATDDLFFTADHLAHSATSMLIGSAQSQAGGLGIPFGDGLLACGGTIKRIWLESACSGGQAEWGAGLQDEGQWNAGDTRIFQVWYRDPNGPCHSTINFTNAVQVTFTP